MVTHIAIDSYETTPINQTILATVVLIFSLSITFANKPPNQFCTYHCYVIICWPDIVTGKLMRGDLLGLINFVLNVIMGDCIFVVVSTNYF